MLKQIVLLFLITLVPALELRASIPWGILGNEKWGIEPGLMSWPAVVGVCVVANILLGFAIFWLLPPVMNCLNKLVWFRRFVEPVLEHARRRLHPYVEKYGELGVAVFIGIPLPGSGVYTGAVGAFVIGLDRRKFAVANVLGVIIAGSIVTMLVLLIKAGIALPWVELWLKTPAGS